MRSSDRRSSSSAFRFLVLVTFEGNDTVSICKQFSGADKKVTQTRSVWRDTRGVEVVRKWLRRRDNTVHSCKSRHTARCSVVRFVKLGLETRSTSGAINGSKVECSPRCRTSSSTGIMLAPSHVVGIQPHKESSVAASHPTSHNNAQE